MHANGGAPEVFSPRERRGLGALLAAAIPAGEVFPGADATTVARVEGMLAAAGPAVVAGYRALLASFEAAALVGYARALPDLSPDACLALIERWRRGDLARRSALRALLGPAKLLHFDDPAVYHRMGCVYRPLAVAEARPRYVEERTAAAADLRGETLDCDVVVIGTGAGGAVVARELSERGVAVVLVEEGEAVTRADFSGSSLDRQRRLYRDGGASFTVGNAAIFLPTGRAVGGSTVINSGTCYRAPDRVLHGWADDLGLDDLRPDRLAPYYERVEKVLGVGANDARHLGGVARVIARGCDALGYSHHPLRRNAPDCDGQGMCCFGCPTDAKRSTNISYVPPALRAGATLVTGLRAEHVLVSGGRAVGITGRPTRGGGADDRVVTVRARAVVVACGALHTPIFLGDNHLGRASGQLGRNLSIHPASGAAAIFDERIDGANAVPQGYAIDAFHDEGILFEGAFAPLDVTAGTCSLVGRPFMDLMEAYDRLAVFGFLIEDSGRGRVRRGPGGKPLVTYMVSDHDVARLKRGVEILARVYFAAGARRVMPMIAGHDLLGSEADVERFRGARLRARDFDLSAYHPLGTARMGRDPRASVVDPDHQVHDAPGVYVVDGSAVPSPPGVNPQLTIMALATRAAERIEARLG